MSRRALGFGIVMVYLIAGTVLAAVIVQLMHGRSAPTAGAPGGSVAAGNTAPPKYLVLMVLDGARPDYFSLTALPHVDALRRMGVEYTNAIDGILEAETPAAFRECRGGVCGAGTASNGKERGGARG